MESRLDQLSMLNRLVLRPSLFPLSGAPKESELLEFLESEGRKPLMLPDGDEVAVCEDLPDGALEVRMTGKAAASSSSSSSSGTFSPYSSSILVLYRLKSMPRLMLRRNTGAGAKDVLRLDERDRESLLMMEGEYGLSWPETRA